MAVRAHLGDTPVMRPPRPDPGRLAHLITGTAEEQVQDAAERRDEDDDGRPRSLRQAACMVCLGQAARAVRAGLPPFSDGLHGRRSRRP